MNHTPEEIIDRLKTAIGVDNDKYLVSSMDITIRRLNTWRRRNAISYKEITSFCADRGIDLNQIFAPDNKIGTRTECERCILTPIDRLESFEISSSQIVRSLHFNPDWVKHVLNLDAANLVLIRIVTNNMALWATDGDLVIIDISQTAIVADSPYILQYGDVLVPKRLVCQNDGTIVAKSDSQYCDDEVYPSDVKPPRILGRIIRRVVR
jgi:hypothetical protein